MCVCMYVCMYVVGRHVERVLSVYEEDQLLRSLKEILFSSSLVLQSSTPGPSASGALWMMGPAVPRASFKPVILLFHIHQPPRLLGLRRTLHGWGHLVENQRLFRKQTFEEMPDLTLGYLERHSLFASSWELHWCLEQFEYQILSFYSGHIV